MRIVCVSQRLEASGNLSTISRIGSTLAVRQGHDVVYASGYVEPSANAPGPSPPSSATVASTLPRPPHSHAVSISSLEAILHSTPAADVIIGLHCLWAGVAINRALRDDDIPYVLILGGTDANEMAFQSARAALISEALERSAVVVCFDVSLKHALDQAFPSLLAAEPCCRIDFDKCKVDWGNGENESKNSIADSLPATAAHSSSSASSSSSSSSRRRAVPWCVIPQGVQLAPAAAPPQCFASLHALLGVDASHHIFILPAAIRAVKDPWFLAQVRSARPHVCCV